MFKLTFLLLLLTVFASPFYCQNKPSKINSTPSQNNDGKSKLLNPEAKTPFPYNHSVDKGLPDKSGNLWFATSEGIYRYDGKLFTKYQVMDGLLADHVACMLQDKAGNIWFGARCGIVRYSPSAVTGSGSPLFTGVKMREANGNGFLADVKGNDVPDPKNTVTQMIEDPNGAIWFCVGFNLYRTDGKSLAAITTAVGDYLKSERAQYHCTYPDDFGIAGIYQDKQGNILISTIACSCGPNVIYRLDGSRTNHPCILNSCKHDLHNPQELAAHNKEIASSFSKISNEEGNTKIAFTTVLEDKSGTIWIGSDSGVYRYDGMHLTHFTKGDLLSKSVVNNIYEDKKGNIWFGTGESADFKGNGVFLYEPSASAKPGSSSITQFTTKDGLCNNGPFKSNIVSSIAEDNMGKLWISGDGGVSYYNGKGFTSLTKKDGFTNQPVKCMAKDKVGNLWFGTWLLGLYRYDGISLICFTENMPEL